MVPKVKLVTELPWFNWIEEIGDPRQSNSQRKRTDPRFPISQESRLTKYVQGRGSEVTSSFILPKISIRDSNFFATTFHGKKNY